MLPPLIIVSYADKGQNHNGYIYQATNFLYTGATKERTDISTQENKHKQQCKYFDIKQYEHKQQHIKQHQHKYECKYFYIE